MPPRLVDQYRLGDPVDIRFRGSDVWHAGRIVRHAHPGVWVQTENGQVWFVTNTRNIRRREEGSLP